MHIIQNYIFVLTCCNVASISPDKKRNHIQCHRTTSYRQSLQRVRPAVLTDRLNKNQIPITVYPNTELYDICSLCPLNVRQSKEIRKQQSKLKKIHFPHYLV